MGHWTKHYLDGSKYTATDLAIAQGKASWQRSKMTGMIGAELQHERFSIEIWGLGEFWQSDLIVSHFPITEGLLHARRIQKRIEPSDLICRYMIAPSSIKVFFETKYTTSQGVGKLERIPSSHIGSWLVLEIDLHNQTIKRYFSKERV